MKELYDIILFDDGRAPKVFTKDHLDVDRQEINNRLKKDVRITSRNLRNMNASKMSNAQQPKEIVIKSYDAPNETVIASERANHTAYIDQDIRLHNQNQSM